jgi:hypothetical protein
MPTSLDPTTPARALYFGLGRRKGSPTDAPAVQLYRMLSAILLIALRPEMYEFPEGAILQQYEIRQMKTRYKRPVPTQFMGEATARFPYKP